MGTRLTVVIETELDIDYLRRAVSMWDADASGEEDAIAPENVTAWDVIMMAATGNLAFVSLTEKVEWDEEGQPDLRTVLNEAGGDIHRAFDGVVTNEMKVI